MNAPGVVVGNVKRNDSYNFQAEASDCEQMMNYFHLPKALWGRISVSTNHKLSTSHYSPHVYILLQIVPEHIHLEDHHSLLLRLPADIYKFQFRKN